MSNVSGSSPRPAADLPSLDAPQTAKVPQRATEIRIGQHRVQTGDEAAAASPVKWKSAWPRVEGFTSPGKTKFESVQLAANTPGTGGAAATLPQTPADKLAEMPPSLRSIFAPADAQAASGPAAAQPTGGLVAAAAPGPATPQQKADAAARGLATVVNRLDDLGKSHPAHGAGKAAVLLIGEGFEALAKTPAGHLEMGEHIADMTNIAAALDQAVKDFGKLAGKDAKLAALADQLKPLAEGLRADIDARKGSLDRAMDNNPLSENAVFKSKSFTTAGAIGMIDKRLETMRGDPTKQDACALLENAKSCLADRHAAMLGRNDLSPLAMTDIQSLMGSAKVDKGIVDKEAKKEIGALLDKADFARPDGVPDLPLSHPGMREDGMMQMFLESVFKQAGVEAPKDIRGELLGQRLEALNAQTWAPIEKQVVLQHGGAQVTMDSAITPQSHLGRTFDDMKGGGVNCHMAQSTHHVTTLAASSLKVGGETLFEGIRHGTLTAYDISSEKLKSMSPGDLSKLVMDVLPKSAWARSDGQPALDKTVDRIQTDATFRSKAAKLMRAEATYNRAVDVATSALVKNEAKLQAALAAARSDPPGAPVSINLSSVALLTPDEMRTAMSKNASKGGNEKLMLADQLAAWDRLSAGPQPREIDVKDPATGETVKVKVNVDVTAFNFGVNKLAVDMSVKAPNVGRLFNHFTVFSATGWETSDKRNARSMERLIGSPAERQGGIAGRVGEWLKTAPRDTPEARQKAEHVETLARQIGEIFDAKSHRTQGVEPYKMVSRLAVLASMMGDDACWNCKSGKDRTGECDSEAKFLAAQIHLTGRVPEPEVERTTEEKSNLFRMAVDGGNQEIQALNSGAPGYKLGGVSALADQYEVAAGEPHYKYFQGIAGFYGS